SGQITTHWTLNTVAIDPRAPGTTQAARGNLATLQGWLPIDYASGARGPTMLRDTPSHALSYPSLNANIELAMGATFPVSPPSARINLDPALPQTISAPTFTYPLAHPGTRTVPTDYDPEQMRTFLQTYIRQHTDAAATAAAGTTVLPYGEDT